MTDLDMHGKPCPSLASGWLVCRLTGAEPETPEVTLVKSTHEYNVDGRLCFCFCPGNSFTRPFEGRVFEGVFVLKQSRGDEQQSADRTGGRHPAAASQHGGEGETGGKRGTCSTYTLSV